MWSYSPVGLRVLASTSSLQLNRGLGTELFLFETNYSLVAAQKAVDDPSRSCLVGTWLNGGGSTVS